MHAPRPRILSLLAAFALLALVGGLAARPVRAQTSAVSIANFAFSPATLTITVGTTVTWTNNDSVGHTSTSDSGDAVSWSSPTLGTGQSFSFTFTQAGTFPYHCAIHPFMHGTIIVQQAAVTDTATPVAASTPVPTSVAAPTPIPTAAPTATSLSTSTTTVPPRGIAFQMGRAGTARQTVWMGYYDGHLDTYTNTDVSNKAQAAEMHVNYAPGLAHVALSTTPAIYLVKGRAVTNQPAVFGSEPGESDYSPIWHEVIVRWKAGAKAQLLTSDNQILKLAGQHKLTVRQSHILLNCPILKVGK